MRGKSKRSLSVIGVFILFAALCGQAFPAGGYGIKAGLNFADLEGDVKPQYDIEGASKVTYIFGVFVSIEYASFLHIQPELLLSMKGAQSDEADVEGEVKLTYIEIPVLAKVSLLPHSKIGPSLYAGPVADLMLDASLESGAYDLDIKDWVTNIDYGIVLGAGLDFKLGQGKIVIDGRYNIGMTNINDTANDWEIKNRTFSVFLGYQF